MVSDILCRIQALTIERQALYATAAGRWLTPAELVRIAEITSALYDLWEQRRQELAKRPHGDHELILVDELRERAMGR